jgi:hypothetical protein
MAVIATGNLVAQQLLLPTLPMLKMMPRQRFNAKLPQQRSGRLKFCFLLFILGHTLTMGQGLTTSKADTLSLSDFSLYKSDQ